MNNSLLEKIGIKPKIVEKYIERVKNGERIITIAGRFSAGKSSFINAFIGCENFLEVANVECTPIMVELVRDEVEKIIVKYSDGTEKEENYDVNKIKKYTKLSDEYDKNIVGISIYGDFGEIDEKCHLIDTPGTDTPNSLHEFIANMIVRKSDIVIYVFNKTISQTDLDKIKEIKQYTEDIIFVMTHVDEKVDDKFIKMEEKKVNKLIDAAKFEIDKVFNNPDILPISSKVKDLEESNYEEVREVVRYLSKKNNKEKVKKRVKLQLEIIFEEKLKELKESYDLEKEVFDKDIKSKDKEYTKNNYKLNEINLEFRKEKNNIDELIKKNSKEIEKNIEIIYKKVYKKIENEIDNASNIENEIDIENIKIEIKKEVQKLLDEVLNKIVDDIYTDNNNKIEEILDALGTSLDIRIKKPNISEIEVYESREERELKIDILDIVEEKEKISNDVEYKNEKVNQLYELMQKKDVEVERVKNIVMTKEAYVPEYNEVIEEGFGGFGKAVGSVVGEVADLALFFVPVAGALKAADVVKDGIMAGTMVSKAVSKAANSNSGNTKLGKTATVISEIGNKLSISNLLSKVGETVGSAIKPEKKYKVENEEKKIQWENEDNKIREELAHTLKEKKDLEKYKEEYDLSIRESMMREKKIERKLLELEEELKIHQKKKIEKVKNEIFKKAREDYKNEIEKNLEVELEQLKVKIDNLIGESSKIILQKSKIELDKKMKNLNGVLENINKSKEEREKVLKDKLDLIEEVKHYDEWIEEWIM